MKVTQTYSSRVMTPTPLYALKGHPLMSLVKNKFKNVAMILKE